MTAQTIDRGETQTPDRDIPAVPMTRLIRVELRKLVDTRSGFWLLVTIGLVTAAAVAIFLFAADADELTYGNFVGVTASPQGVLLPVLGIMAVTTEWTQRTSLVTHALEPNRVRIAIAKLVATLLIGALFVALALGFAALANVIGISSFDGDGSWEFFGWEGLRNSGLLQLAGLVQGLAFGMLLMNTAAAIVLFFVLPTVTGIVFGLVERLADVAPWIDLGTAQAPLFTTGTVDGEEWLQLLTSSLIWIVLPLAAGTFRLLRREIK